MNEGDSVRVKHGILNPDDESMDIGGWEGRITQIDVEFIEFEFDSITLKQLPSKYIIECVEEGFFFTKMTLEKDELDIVAPRDTIEDVLAIQQKLDEEYDEPEIARIKVILNSNDLEVNEDNLDILKNELKSKLPKDLLLTGREPFSWEERYLFFEKNDKEYNNKRLTTASFKDSFKLMGFNNHLELPYGLFVRIQRTTDNKQFVLPLCDLKTKDENSPHSQLLKDYSSWITNY